MLINYYDRIIKFVEMEKQECMQSMKEPWTRLKGDERMLFRLIKEGPAKDIKPAMVSKVIDGLAIESSREMEMLKSEVIEVGNRVVQTVQKYILEIRKLWGTANEAKKEEEAAGVVKEIKKPEEPEDFRFSREMCKNSIKVISEGKEIKMVGSNLRSI